MGNLSSLLQPSVAVQPSTLSNAGAELGMRNRIINGAMAVDQRNSGGSQTITAGAALAYAVDRWYAYSTGANVTGQRVAGATANTFRYRFTGATSVSAIGFGTRIEALNCADMAGGAATLSVDLANSLLTTVTWTAYYATTADTFGTLASPTRTQIATGSFTVNSTVARYSAQISIPPGATTGIEIVFSVGAQTSGTWTIGNIQLEKGGTATPFEWRSYGQELALCQRYYYRMTYLGVYASNVSVGVGTADSATSALIYVSFPVTMRYPPYGLETNGTAANYGVRNAGPAVVACSSVPFINNWDVFGARVTFQVASGLTAGQSVMGNLSVAGAYLAFNAEI